MKNIYVESTVRTPPHHSPAGIIGDQRWLACIRGHGTEKYQVDVSCLLHMPSTNDLIYDLAIST